MKNSFEGNFISATIGGAFTSISVLYMSLPLGHQSADSAAIFGGCFVGFLYGLINALLHEYLDIKSTTCTTRAASAALTVLFGLVIVLAAGVASCAIFSVPALLLFTLLICATAGSTSVIHSLLTRLSQRLEQKSA
ncbi:MAG TPA: hypothetical protein V6C89_10295 [Drouetiella sp.]|jgi:hypothetical protein